MPLFIAVLLGLSGILIVIYPLLGVERRAADPASPESLTEVVERERTAKVALRDLDFDYRLGNLDESDYQSLRDRYERRALAALKTRYEREQELDDLIDQQLAALRGKTLPAASKSRAAEIAKSGKNGNAVVLPPSQQPTPPVKATPARGEATHTVRPRRRKGV